MDQPHWQEISILHQNKDRDGIHTSVEHWVGTRKDQGYLEETPANSIKEQTQDTQRR